MIFDPHRAVVGVLLLPDRHDRLELVDGGARRCERGVAMRRPRGDDDRDLADGEVADAVVHDETQRRVLGLETSRDLTHLRLGHLRIGLVLEMRDHLPAAAVAHRAEEHDDAAESRVAHRRKRVVDRQRRGRDGDRCDGHGTARHGRDESDLVAIRERLLGRDVLVVSRDHDLTAFGDERMVLQDVEDRVLHLRSGWQIELDLTNAGSLPIRREQAHQHAHSSESIQCENSTGMDAAEALRGAVIAFVLVIANGFFVASEYSFVRVRATQLDELARAGSVRAKLAARIADRLDSYISAAQLGITLASLAIGWIGEPAIAALVAPIFGWLPEPLFHLVAFALAFGAITYAHIVIGELAPKYLAIQRAVQLALLFAYPFDLFYR